MYSLTEHRGKTAAIMSIPRSLAFAAGGLGSVSTNNNAALTYLKHLAISNVSWRIHLQSSYFCCTSLLFISPSIISLLLRGFRSHNTRNMNLLLKADFVFLLLNHVGYLI